MLNKKAAAIEQLDSVEDIWTATKDTLEPYGISFLNYLTVDSQFSAPFLLSNIAEIYGEAPPEADPFLHHCCTSYEITLTGAAYLADYAYLPDEAQAFIKRAQETGFLTGLGIPMRLRGSARFGGFNLGTSMDRPEFEAKILPRQDEFRLLCLLVHRRIEELSSPETSDEAFRSLLISPDAPNLSALTDREREIAYLIASGMTRKECAQTCAISPNTVSDYVKAIYRKLGVNNRVHLARMMGLSNAAE